MTLNLLNSLFDTAKSTVSGFLSRDTWLQCLGYLQQLLALIDSQPLVKEKIMKHSELKVDENVAAASTVDGNTEQSVGMDVEKAILPSMANFLEKLDFELLKAFQGTQHTKIEYLQRIRDENKFLFLCDYLLRFFHEYADLPKAARVAILKMDHIYYKNDQLYRKMHESG